VSWACTKALIWAIEQRLECQAGLYRWVDDTGEPGDLQAVQKDDFDDWHSGKPILVFIHGTASSTLGSFGDLSETRSAREWDRLFDTYGRHIYAFEHRTFSESPIENALALVRSLPAEARLSVVTHSRGGLVGDLLCMDALGEGLAAGFTRNDEDLKLADEEDRKYLLELTGELAQKKFRIERYVRVASPARGTLLAGCHLDAFLSTLLHLIGLVPYLQVSPAYAVAKRIILQIVKNRTDPRLVPGIEAMLPDSPLAALVGQAQPKEGAEIGVIAGDIEGGGLLKRIGVFLTDYIFFEEEDNDLVVDTDSMYGGLARERGHYLFDQGADVSHFRYFANARTRRALQAWLTDEKPRESRLFLPIIPEPKEKRVRAAAVGSQPALIFLPGIMGSHLRVGDKDRVWFKFFDIAGGGMKKVRYDKPDIYPDGLFNRFYDDLCDYLEESHKVHRFAYDWRRPLQDEADRLTFALDQALNQTQKAVRIMAHSMGGLVVRMMIARHREVWKRLTEREGARFIMLGTPNRGSHLMVETLLGMSDTIRMLTVLDGKHQLQWWLDLVAEYPGALQLLPQPGFTDAANSQHDYYDLRVWEDFKNINNDFWFGQKLGATPAADRLNQVKESWGALKEELPDIEKIVYVAGYGQRTPCGIELDQKRKRLRMIGTLNGDGSVTHASGLLDSLIQKQRVWYMDSDHGGLTGKEETFPALLELLERGETARLPKTRPAVRGAEETFRYEAGPVLYPTEQSLALSLVGGRQPVQRRARAKYTLSISCRAMDLRHAIHPILVGHYEGDPISGAEAQIDRFLIKGGLNRRYHMGTYAGKPGTTTVALPRPSEEQVQAGVQRGAVVIGLGSYGNLTAGRLGEAVRDGVLRYLLHFVDIWGGRLPEEMAPRGIGLATLLLGYNSTTNISIADSLHAIVRGVIEANRQFAEAMESPLRVDHLELIELFLDVAISAAGALRRVTKRLDGEAESMGCYLEPALTLTIDKSAQQRLEAISGTSYWPRLTITDADRHDDFCPPESREKPRLPAGLEDILPPECLEKLGRNGETAPLLPTHPRRRSELARKLRFMYLSQRARAETELHQRQPGLVETLVESSIRDSSYKPDLSNTLYQLLIPHDFKETARQIENLVLVVDGYTANLPWEMLAANNEPLIKNTAIVRQFSTTHYRPKVRNTLDKTAYVVGDPSTEGYYTAFPDANRPDADRLDPLPGAEKESMTVRRNLESQGYEVVMAPSGSKGVDVINKLFKKPYRIIHISAHGVFQAGEGEDARSGVVLSDGLLLTAVEIGQLEVVPDLVFLNCCFLGKVNNPPKTAYNRLAYSVARELIEIGVRAVVVAGWAVRDDAGEFFAETFYRTLLHERKMFGDAIHTARQMTYEDPHFSGCNTWGAYQAYGDPGFHMDPSGRGPRGNGPPEPVAIVELVASVYRLHNEVSYAGKDTRHLRRQLKDLLKKAPKDWQNMPEVLYACGRFYGELKDFAEAIRCFERAVAIEDKEKKVPVTAIEQLANFEARQGEKKNDIDLIRRAIDRLRHLVKAAGGVDAAGNITGTAINCERCALLGSAYKRLAGKLADWSMETDEPEKPKGIKQALALSAKWYETGEGDPHQPGFSPYNAQNRLALQAVLGIATNPEDAKLARQAGKIAHARYATSRDFYDMIMVGDGELIAGIIDKSLMKAFKVGDKLDAAEAVIKCYTELVKELPKSMRQFDSVVTQIKLLKTFMEKRAKAETREDLDLDNLAKNLGRIAAALESSAAAGAKDAKTGAPPADDEEKTPPGRGGKGSAKRAKSKTAPKTKVPRSGKRPKK
jgi:CHAT domain-containing protein/pimeloyl-ACP methyl ester carboxylesterase